MAKKTMYMYQMSLANGKIVMHKTEGLFTNGESEDEKVLINSATLVQVYEEDVETKDADESEESK